MDRNLVRVLEAARRISCPEKLGWFAAAQLMRRDIISKDPEQPLDNYMEENTWADYKHY
jgi:hypothetical protein